MLYGEYYDQIQGLGEKEFCVKGGCGSQGTLVCCILPSIPYYTSTNNPDFFRAGRSAR